MSELISPELQSKIAGWRQKAQDGTLTIDEMREGIVLMRQGRMAASVASDASRKARAKVAVPDAKSLLATLGGMKS